jgi:hypothetical protein
MEESASPGLPVVALGISIMPGKSRTFDSKKPVAHDGEAKHAFHTQVRRWLRLLGTTLGLTREGYDLRTAKADISVSGEVALHGDHSYVRVSQPAAGFDDEGILFRTCERREDYAGGDNNFASLDLLHRPKELARLIKEKCGV